MKQKMVSYVVCLVTAFFVSSSAVCAAPLGEKLQNIPLHAKHAAIGLALLASGITLSAVFGSKQGELANRVARLKQQKGTSKNRKLSALIRKLQWGRAGHISLQVANAIMVLLGGHYLIKSYSEWPSSSQNSPVKTQPLVASVPAPQRTVVQTKGRVCRVAANGDLEIVPPAGQNPSASHNWGNNGKALGGCAGCQSERQEAPWLQSQSHTCQRKSKRLSLRANSNS